MKVKILVSLFVLTLLTAFGCSGDAINSSSDDQSLEVLNRTVLDEELVNAQNAGINLENVDALFSLGWHPRPNPETGEEELRGEAFAVAPSEDATSSPRLKNGLDMGTVSLSYGGESVELDKMEKRNGGIFYSLGKPVRHGRGAPTEENSVDIPFVAGETYSFSTTGGESFPAISASITAPDQPVTITSHTQDSEVDVTTDLNITWDGGVADQPIMISVSAAPERGEFNGPGGRGGPRGPGGRGGRGQHGPPPGDGGFGPQRPGGPGGFGHGIQILLDTNPGNATITAEELQTLLAEFEASALRIHVMQIQMAQLEQDDAVYAVHLRSGDGVGVQIAN